MEDRPISIEESLARTFWACIYPYIKGAPADTNLFGNPETSRIILALTNKTDVEMRQFFFDISDSMGSILSIRENNSDEYWRNIFYIKKNFDFIWNAQAARRFFLP